MSELDLRMLIEHFAQSKKAEGRSPKTLHWYSEMLADFTRHVSVNGGTACLGDFHVESVRQFIVTQQDKGLSPCTVQDKVRALKVFSSWLLSEGYTEDNILATVKLPKVPVKVIDPLTDEEVNRLITVQNPLTAIGSRNIAILLTLLDAGVRVSELCGLHREDAHIEEGYLKVMGKGSRERVVPIGALVQKVLWRYVYHFRPEPLKMLNDYLFLTLDGTPPVPDAVRLLLTRWGRKAGVSRLHAHLCRHTYATNFLLHRCGDVFRLQQILGHSTLEMVRRYVHFASTRDMIQGCVQSPIDHIGIRKLRGYGIDRSLRNGNGHTR